MFGRPPADTSVPGDTEASHSVLRLRYKLRLTLMVYIVGGELALPRSPKPVPRRADYTESTEGRCDRWSVGHSFSMFGF
ncbi:hypothetical protein RRG08_027880 [Elysia crispata]|uniref:Uncharacterized protein n=1 Tax=Elysia crispata TaxID=231223 RepID=A0AAE1A7A5_9GAST|nr:hypothetical protein RRG08_027880 [Elysia crispata]